MLNMHEIVGSHDILFITLDTLRYDVACEELNAGRLPFLQSILPEDGWEKRHTPGSFTFAAHQAFFAGFLPTPARPGNHPRIFAVEFPGNQTTVKETCSFDAPDIVTGLRSKGYLTACIGGVGFFNSLTPIGCVLPGLFCTSFWSPDFAVTNYHSTRRQVECAVELLEKTPADQRIFLFINISALHQPNRIYLDGANEDTVESHAAALRYVDSELPPLAAALRRRGRTFAIICSDHGTAYGEEGFKGHRLGHDVVWTVPYAECIL
jgi:hypothetical protein